MKDRGGPERKGAPTVRIFEDPAALARAAAQEVLEAARATLSRQASFHMALAGGSTPRAAYSALASSAKLDFERWHLWFGDERCVAPDHPDSNFGMVRASGLLERVPSERVHRLRGEALDPGEEARRYSKELVAALGSPPALDLVLLGLGPDGHTASLFPGTEALAQSGWVTVGQAPKPPHTRLTLTFSALRNAKRVTFLVAGPDKAEALGRVLSRDSSLPAHRLLDGPPLHWLVERAAVPPWLPGIRGCEG